MISCKFKLTLFLLAFLVSLNCSAQQQNTTVPKAGDASGTKASGNSPKADIPDNPTPSSSQDSNIEKRVTAIEDSLKKQKDSDFAVTLGIGSLVIAHGVTDYSNNSNVLQTNNLGRATPQYLIGVSMRSRIPNFRKLGGTNEQCNTGTPEVPAKTDSDSKKKELLPMCETWRRRPWEGFVNLKLSPQSSSTLNGYVIGGSYAIAKYLDALIGFALTPVNAPAPGFRVAASQYVTSQQALGLDLNFSPAAMLANSPNAFDGFPLVDSSGKLIYKGNALTTNYRGGVVFGVSVPFTFSSVFSGGSK